MNMRAAPFGSLLAPQTADGNGVESNSQGHCVVSAQATRMTSSPLGEPLAQSEHDPMGENVRARALVKKLDAIGWGVFFIWMGIAFLADVGWGVGLLGVGVIALGGQVARRYFGLPFERFGLAIGIVFVVWGLWELLAIRFGEAPIPGGLLPILFIVLGIVLVVSALRKQPG